MMRMRQGEIDATLLVERAIRALLARDETPRIDLVADALGTSVRTLQRRLAEAGSSFMVLDRSCLAAAVDVLAHTDAKAEARVIFDKDGTTWVSHPGISMKNDWKRIFAFELENPTR